MEQEQTYDFECVWMTSGERGVPHAAALQASNPGLATHVWTAAESGQDGWRNFDRQHREFWKQEVAGRNAEELPGRVLFLEYDTLVNIDLRTIFPASRKCSGIEGAHLKMPVQDGRSYPPLGEVDRLPRPMRAYACGISPLAVAMIAREALDAVADEAFDEIFAGDIYCEMRLPTLVRWCGFKVVANRALGAVEWTPLAHPGLETPGIFHPVKGAA